MVSLLVIVRLLSGPTPEFDLTQGGFMTPQECTQFAAKANSVPPEPKTTASGKVILFSQYQCVLLTGADAKEAVEKVTGE